MSEISGFPLGPLLEHKNGLQKVSVPEEQITAYLSKIQRGGLVQPFGCLLAIEESSFKIISFSENC
uniref:PAS fold-2 domain-containing protein n=1 Tax=Cucumis sativus TaxID=3659 RepID=A0A0A0LZL9_CUCSA